MDESYYTEWFPLKEFPDSQYEINMMGQIRNTRTLRILKGSIGPDGYLSYVLTVNGKVYRRFAHILVATQFIPNPNNSPVVNHIDEDRTNPCKDNLEWVTYAQNSRHGRAQAKSVEKRGVMINEYALDGRYIRTWKSAKNIYIFFGLPYDRQKRTNYLVKILTNNDKQDTEKIIFANRVFMRFKGNTNDIKFRLKPPANYRNDMYRCLNTPENVPAKYLYNPNKMIENAYDIISKMLEQKRYIFSADETYALKYALFLIQKENN